MNDLLLFLYTANDEIKEESKGYQWESIGLYCRHWLSHVPI